MRILVLTLMMSFLSHSAFGADTVDEFAKSTAAASIIEYIKSHLCISDQLLKGGRTKQPYYIRGYPNEDIERLSEKLIRLRNSLIAIPDYNAYIISLTIARTARIGECGEASALAGYRCLESGIDYIVRLSITGGNVFIPGKIDSTYNHSFIIIPIKQKSSELADTYAKGKFIQNGDIIIDAFLGISFTYSESSCSMEQSHWIQYLNRYLLGQGKKESQQNQKLSNRITIILREELDKSQKEFLDNQLKDFEIKASTYFSGESSIFGSSPGPWRDSFSFPIEET